MKGEVLPLAFSLQCKCLLPFLRVTRDWRASNISLKPIHSPNAKSQNFETTFLFSIVERSSTYVFRDMNYDNPPQLSVGPICFKLKLCFKINQKALCLWLPIRHFSNISRTTRGIKLKLLRILLLLLLLLQLDK